MQCTIKLLAGLLALTVLCAQGNKPVLHPEIAKKIAQAAARNMQEKAHCSSSSSSSSDCDPCDTLDAIETVNATVDEILVVVNELLDQRSEGCSLTIIHATDFISSAYTITASGDYCLADNVTGRIVVNARSVTLDLGSHIITVLGNNLITSVGVRVNTDEVVVKNGVIEGAGQPTTPTANSKGIDTTAGSNNRIENVVTRFLGTGIIAGPSLTVSNVISSNNNNGLVGTSDNLSVSNSLFNFNIVTGMDYSAGNNLSILNSSFVDNNKTGVQFAGLYVHDGADSIHIEGCNFDRNGNFEDRVASDGAFVDGCSCIEIINCFATGNGMDGFHVRGIIDVSTDVVVRDCFTCDNGNNDEVNGSGFNFVDATNVAVYNCIADNNFNGFLSQGTSLNHLILNCTAENNGVTGFAAFSTSGCVYRNNNAFGHFGSGAAGFFDSSPNGENKFYQNVACNNLVDYKRLSGNYDARISSANTAAAFHNASCSQSAIDFCYPADTFACFVK